MSTLKPATLSAFDLAPSAVAVWVRDDAYRDRAVRMALIDRPAWARFMGPLWIGAAIALLFSPWGLLGSLYGREPFLAHLPAVGLAVTLLVLGAAQTYHAMRKATARQYGFAGDATRWEFSADGLLYRATAPDGTLRHEARSRWSWFKAVSVDVTGLRLYRSGSVESYFIPATGFVQPGQDAGHALHAVAAQARGAGLSVRTVPTWDRAGLLGAWLAASLLIAITMVHAAIAAALPHMRWGRLQALFASGVDTFWWAALVCAASVVGLHLLLAAWQHRRAPARDLPAHAPHLVLALVWGALLLAALQALRSLIFDDALAESSFAAPQTVVLVAVFVLLTGFALHRTFVAPWVARRVALHNDGSGTPL